MNWRSALVALERERWLGSAGNGGENRSAMN